MDFGNNPKCISLLRVIEPTLKGIRDKDGRKNTLFQVQTRPWGGPMSTGPKSESVIMRIERTWTSSNSPFLFTTACVHYTYDNDLFCSVVKDYAAI